MSHLVFFGNGGGGGSGITLTADTGGPLGPSTSFTIEANHAANNSGSTVLIAGSGTTLILNVTDANQNTMIGQFAGSLSLANIQNTALGYGALNTLVSGSENTAIGMNALNAATGTCSNNTAVGRFALAQLGTGDGNIAIGHNAGFAYTGTEANNIVIGGNGVGGDNSQTRIGFIGGVPSQTGCFIDGIDGVNVGSVATVVTEASNKLGTAVITAGSGISVTPGANTITIASTVSPGIITIDGNTGSATGATITLHGTPTTSGTLVFDASGSTVTLNSEDANDNVIVGGFTATLPVGTGNSGFGHNPFAQGSLVTGNFNVAFGYNPFLSLTSGSHNAGFGQQPLLFLTTGSYNLCASAYQGGVNYTSNESNNISINASATTVTGESNVLRIGDGTGTGTQQLQAAFISGIDGIAIPSTSSIVGVASGGQVASSSTFQIDSSNRTTNTSQPAFHAYLSATQPNVTGDGTIYTVVFNSTTFDQGSNYNTGTGVFTAPISGRYYFYYNVLLGTIGVTHTTATSYLNTTPITFNPTYINPGVAKSDSNDLNIYFGTMVSLSGGDTVSVSVQVQGSTKSVAVLGDITLTFFGGYLVC